MANETLWTGFNNQKLFAERARKDEKGRNIATAIDSIPTTYISDASVSGDTLTLTKTANGSTTTIPFSGQQNTIEHIFIGDTTSTNELQPDANKRVVIPVAGQDAQSGQYYGGLLDDTLSAKLQQLDANAQENVIEEVQVNGSALTPTNKSVNVEIPVLGVQRNGTDLTPDSTTKKVNVEVPVLGVQISGDSAALTPDPTTKVVTIPLATASGTGVTGNSGAITAADLANLHYLADAAPNGAAANNPLITQSDLNTAIADFGGFKTATGTGADNHPDVANPDTKFIYLVYDSSSSGDDKYKEWICTDATTTPPTWALIGDTSMSMSGYAKIPSSKTANHIVLFTSTDELLDSGKTISDLENVVETVSIGGGSAISPATGTTNIDIPLAANNSGTGSDGAMSGTDKVKLDGIDTGAQVNTIESISLNGVALSPDTNKNVEITVTVPAASSTTPSMDGTGAAGSSTDYARADHVHPSDTAKADKVTPSASGNLAALDATGNLIDSGLASTGVITGVQLAGTQSPLTPVSGVVTIPNVVSSTGASGGTSGLMLATDKEALDTMNTWTEATFGDNGIVGSESTVTFPVAS